MALSSAFELIDKYGSDHVFERLDPPGPSTSVSAKAMQRRAQEQPLSGDTSQYDVQFYVRHQTLVTAGFPTPPLKGDRVKQGNVVHVVKTVEDLHDQDGDVGGYRLWCRGH